MLKTTIYLPEELDAQLAAEARATGASKAHLIRRAVEKLLSENVRPDPPPLPVLKGGRTRTMEEIDDAIYEHIKESAARR